MFKERTDLALEKHEINFEENIDDGIIIDEQVFNEIKVSRIIIKDESASKKSNLKIGKYITIEVGEIWNKDQFHFNKCIDIIKNELIEMISSNYKKCLVVGLGNRRILSDSIGPKTIDKILVTRHIKTLNKNMFDDLGFYEVSALAPGVLADTGIESLEVVRSIVEETSPDFIIVLDALASRNINRLAKTIQITDSGISPGSGVNNNRKELSNASLSLPVISIGIPTVVDASTMVYNILGMEKNDPNKNDVIGKYFNEKDNFFVSLKETDIIIEKMTKLLSASINCALQRQMKFEDIEELIN